MANFDPYAGMPDDFYYSPGYSAGAAQSSSPFLEIGNNSIAKSIPSKVRNVVPNQPPAPDGGPSPWRFTAPTPAASVGYSPVTRGSGGYSLGTPRPRPEPPFDRSTAPVWGDDSPAGGPSGPGNTPPWAGSGGSGGSGSSGGGGWPWHRPQGQAPQGQAPHWPPRPMGGHGAMPHRPAHPGFGGHPRGMRRPYWWSR